MDEHGRIDTLIKILEGDNAKAFSTMTGIPESSICRIRKGSGKPAAYFERILSAYPQVRRVWLYTGDGEPTKEKRDKGELLLKMESLEREVRRLSGLVDELARITKGITPGKK